MKKIIATILFASPLLLFGQIDFNNPPWEIGCDTVETQLEMNICSQKSFSKADSILSLEYNKLIYYLDSIYLEQKKLISPEGDSYIVEFVGRLKKQKEAVVLSRSRFIAFRESMVEIIAIEYFGGSIQPLVENSTALELTVNQLRILANIKEEIIK